MSAPQAMTGQVMLGNGEIKDLAPPGRRLLARLIDWVILIGVLIVLMVVGIAGAIAGGDDSSLVPLATIGGLVVWVVIVLLYEVTLVALRGQTLGKMVMGIMVGNADDGGVPGWGKSIGRWALPNLVTLIPIVGGLLSLVVYLSLVWDDRRQGWHDKMATTVVITN